MPNKKVPRRDEYDLELKGVTPDLPPNYAGIIRHYRPDLDLRRIYHAKQGKVVDFDILEQFKRVARETKAARQLQNA